MRTQTHIAGAAVFYGGASIIGEMPFSIGTAALAGLAGVLPDIDTRASTIGRLFTPVSGHIERRWGHRTITHSYLAQGIVVAFCTPMLLWGHEAYFYAAVLGYASHPFLDTMTVYGVRLFWPWSDVRCVFPYYNGRPTAYRTETGRRGDSALCALFCVLLIPIILLKAATYERVIRVLQADSSSAVRDYLEMSATHLVNVDLKAEDPGSGRKLEGVFEAIGTIDYNTLLVRDSTGIIYSVGEPYASNFLAISAVCERGRPVKISSRTVVMTGRLLADLEELIPVSSEGDALQVRHFISGTVRIEDTAEITPDPHHFNPIRSAGPMLYLNYATMDDLEELGLGGSLVRQGSVTLRLLLSPSELERYEQAGEDSRIRRVVFHYPRGLLPRLLVQEGDLVAIGDTLAVLDSDAIELARSKLANLIQEQAELRANPQTASQQKALTVVRERQATARKHLDAINEQHERGYASQARLEEAQSDLETAGSELELMLQDQERLRANHRSKLRSLQEKIGAAQLALKITTSEQVITSHHAGTIMHIEIQQTDDEKGQVRVLFSRDEHEVEVLQ